MRKLILIALVGIAGCIPPKLEPIPEFVGERRQEADVRVRRQNCDFGRGVLPQESLGSEVRVGTDIPIDHILVLMLENRSFDHYFGDMEGVDGSIEGATRAPLDHPSQNHSWIGTHVQMRDGFSEEASVYLTAEDLPWYRELYSAWAISDRHFSALPGPTWPNRYMLFGGTSYGMVINGVADLNRIDEGSHLFMLLDRAQVDWRVYFTDVPFAMGALPMYSVKHMDRFRSIAHMYRDLAEGDIPEFVFIEPGYIGPNRTDEHAPANPQLGEAFTRTVVEALQTSPIWERSALFITYDEHGGLYDHVTPPMGCAPGDWEVPAGNPGSFAERGFRVPLVVVSPWVKQQYVSHQVTDATSILRFIEARFELPALTGRDANAWPLMDLFDFDGE